MRRVSRYQDAAHCGIVGSTDREWGQIGHNIGPQIRNYSQKFTDDFLKSDQEQQRPEELNLEPIELHERRCV